VEFAVFDLPTSVLKHKTWAAFCGVGVSRKARQERKGVTLTPEFSQVGWVATRSYSRFNGL